MRRGFAERFQAWLVTGPLGHLWSAVADIVVILARYGWARLRRARPGGAQRRLAGAGSRSSRRR
ncbi:MAG TPA: hypothetical protein VEY90_12270 [Thermoleophilaceae bacterium]|nr:hypothetical protein [Thermoleophilaceae bacterium]